MNLIKQFKIKATQRPEDVIYGQDPRIVEGLVLGIDKHNQNQSNRFTYLIQLNDNSITTFDSYDFNIEVVE